MNSLSSLELTQISREDARVAPTLLTQAVHNFVMPALKINASKNGRPQPPVLRFVPCVRPLPKNEGYAEQTFHIANLDPACLRGLSFAEGVIKARGNEVWVILRQQDNTGVSARLSWSVTAEGKPTIPHTRNNRHALKRLALALA